MTRGPTPRSLAVRNQIKAVLREQYPMPLSTPEVMRALCNDGRDCDSGLAVNRQCVRPESPCPGFCWNGVTHAQLNALRRLGEVEHLRAQGMKAVYWRYVP